MSTSKKHYIYILKCTDNSLYTGYTNDLEKRIDLHNQGKGAKYTKGRGPVKLCYCEEWTTKPLALQREYEIKQMSKKQKLALFK